MFQKIINKGTVLGNVIQNINISFFSKYDSQIYINKDINNITFNDVLYIVDSFPDDIKNIIKDIAIKINSIIKPIDILNIQNEDIFIPKNNGNIKKSKKLWEGWLLFLIYMYIHNIQANNIDYEIEIESIKSKLKLLYSDTENDFATVLKHLKCTETFKSRRISHYIFTNQSGKFNPNLLSQSQISNIISDVTTPLTPTDERAGKKKFGCLHLEELNQRISSKTRCNNLNKLIKDEIIKVLENAHR
ncbi:ABC-three component system protein [Aliarcobacter cryaerophilus]|uniref:ABC-three component system protein n=1 Tax=Aliarcobacter cryaerophilus TaxID=28198 RepID=UPI0021B58185|nr:ABC-three component system protein [Aliarcobacter cryaerophilus]MCT7497466.1 hypothetical protein [Aliarcobacter cryaerophilus]